MSSLKKGDNVSWKSPQGIVTGTVEKKITTDTTLGTTQYRASKDEPKVKVKSNKTSKEAIHKETSVKKIQDKK
jgi:hypothetical protein